jgi:hypothetical protein
MRKATVERASSYATGKRCDIERITHRLEEGHWRRAERYLAGGLSYCTSGSGGGIEVLSNQVPLSYLTEAGL